MVEQPNQVSAGGQRLAFGYYHPGTSNFDTATWLNDTGYVRTLFFVIAPCSTETLDCICPPTLTPPMTLDPSSDGTKTAMLLLAPSGSFVASIFVLGVVVAAVSSRVFFLRLCTSHNFPRQPTSDANVFPI